MGVIIAAGFNCEQSPSSPAFGWEGSWEKTNGPYGGAIFALTYAPNGNLYAGDTRWSGGVFRTAQPEEGWHQAGLPGVEVKCLIADSVGNLYAGTPTGLYHSEDGGDNWDNVGLSDKFVTAIAISPAGHLFAGTRDSSGIFRSTDNAANWIEINSGLTNRYVWSLAISKYGWLYAGTSEGVFRSTDNGDSWEHVSEEINRRSTNSLLINERGDILTGTSSGLYISKNNGDNWTPVTSGMGSYAFAYAALTMDTEGNLYAGTESGQGVFGSTDHGDNWFFLGIPNYRIMSIAAYRDGAVAIGAWGFGVFYSSDNGSTWTQTSTGLAHPGVLSLATNCDGDLFAGGSQGGVYTTSDAGDHWTQPNTGINYSEVTELLVDEEGFIYAMTRGKGPFRSVDNGGSWESIGSDVLPEEILAAAIDKKNRLYCGTTRGLFMSDVQGLNWTLIGFENEWIEALTVNKDRDIFAASTVSGIYRSQDQGQSWNALGLGHFTIFTLVSHPNSGDVFAGTASGHIFRLPRNKSQWVLIAEHASWIRDILIHESSNILVAAYNRGVFRSTDEGKTWTNISTGLTDHALVLSLAVDPNGRIFAGTYRGVFRSVLD